MSKVSVLSVVILVVSVVLLSAGTMRDNAVQAHNFRVELRTPISEKTLKNMTVLLGTKQITFLDGDGDNLTNEYAPEVASIGKIAYGDYDHDGWVDAAMLIQEGNGKAWLAIVHNVQGTPKIRRTIPLDFSADGVEFESDGTIRVTKTHRWGFRSKTYGYTEPYLWESIE